MVIKAIQEFSDDQLISELSSRFDNFIIAGEKHLTKEDKDGNCTVKSRRYYSGSYSSCAGLALAVAQGALIDKWGINESCINYS